MKICKLNPFYWIKRLKVFVFQTEEKFSIIQNHQNELEDLKKQLKNLHSEHQIIEEKTAQLELLIQRDLDLKHLMHFKDFYQKNSQ